MGKERCWWWWWSYCCFRIALTCKFVSLQWNLLLSNHAWDPNVNLKHNLPINPLYQVFYICMYNWKIDSSVLQLLLYNRNKFYGSGYKNSYLPIKSICSGPWWNGSLISWMAVGMECCVLQLLRINCFHQEMHVKPPQRPFLKIPFKRIFLMVHLYNLSCSRYSVWVPFGLYLISLLFSITHPPASPPRKTS